MVRMIEWIVSSSALLAVLIVLRHILKGKISLRLQYALWGLALLRLLVPVSFGSTAVSVANALPEETRSLYARAVSADPYGLGTAIVRDTIYLGREATIKTGTESSTYQLPRQQDAYEAHRAELKQKEETFSIEFDEHALQGWIEILLGLWITGMAAVALCLFGSNLRFALRLRKSRNLLQRETLPVYLTEEADTPCLFGLTRPAVYVTPEAAEDPARLRHVIEHELTHYRHADHLWSLLRGLCLILHWYNPLVWWGAILSRRDCELACDEATIRRLGEGERSAYGRTLIYMTCAKRPAILVTATTMTGSKRSIKERISLLVKKPRTAIITLVAVLLAAAVAVGCTFTGGKTKETPEPSEAPATAAPSPSPTAAPSPAPTALPEDATLYDRFFAEADPENLTWTLTDGERTLSGSWAEAPFPIPPVEGYAWSEGESLALDPMVDPPHTFGWVLSITDETRDAGMDFCGQTAYSMDLVVCTIGEESRIYICPYAEDMGPDAAYPNDAATKARLAIVGDREVPQSAFFLPTSNTEPEAVARDYAGAYVGQFIEALLGNPYKAYEATVDTRVMEVREDGEAVIFQDHIGFDPAEPSRFAAVMGAGNGGWNEEEQRFYVWRYFCLEKTNGGWTGVDLDVLDWYSEYTAVYGDYFASVPNPKADEAIHRAVMDFNRGNYKSGEAACESHVLVAEESEPGSAGTMVETYYLMILYQEYDWVDGAPKVVGGSYIPSALTFEVSPEGEYTLLEYWTPRDGSHYWDDLRARFPAEVPDEDLDTQNPKYADRVHTSCDAQARAYFAAAKEPVREDRSRVQLRLDLGEQTVPEPVAQYALEVAQQELDYYELSCGYVFDDARITAITYIDTGTVGLWEGYNLYRLEWRFHPAEGEEILPVGGMTMEDGYLTEWSSAGQPYILIGWKNSNGVDTWERICVTDTDMIETEYGTPEMIEKYGNAYTAAAVELRAKAREQQSLLNPLGFSVASPASDPAMIGQDWAKAYAARFTRAPEDDPYYCRSMEVRSCEVYAESLLNEPKQYVYVMGFACDPADADSFCSQLAGWGQDGEQPDWLRFDWFVVLEDDLKGGWRCAQAGTGGYGGWGYLNYGWEADELLDRLITEQVGGEDVLMLLPLIDWGEFDQQCGFGSETWNALWRKLDEACVSEGRLYDSYRSLRWSDVFAYDQVYRDMYVILGFLHSDGAYAEGLANLMAKQYDYDPMSFEQCMTGYLTEEQQRLIRLSLENERSESLFSPLNSIQLRFYDASGRAVSDIGGWYDLGGVDAIAISWTGVAPLGVRLMIAPTGTGTYELTQLLAQRTPTQEELERGEVRFPLSELDASSLMGHLWAELDYGTELHPSTYYQVYREVQSVALNRQDITLFSLGESYTLVATVTPAGTGLKVAWTSDDPEVATVDENGTVTAVGHGTTVVRASAGGVTAECIVRVSAVSTRTEKVDPAEEEPVTVTLLFYEKPTREKTTPDIGRTITISGDRPGGTELINEIKSFVDKFRFWNDDYLTDRVQFYFDGDITFSDRESVYYFSYEQRELYYDHYFVQITSKDVEYLKSLG